MSKPGGRSAPSSAAFLQQAQRLKSFRSLLDPTDLLPGHNVADLYSLRHLCLQGGGIPDTASTSSDGWLRAQAWRVLLGYLTPEKSEWDQLLEKRRAEYYQFVRDFLPQDGGSSIQSISGKLSERDALLDLIYRDLARSRKNAFAFYREEVKPSSSCPLAPLPLHSSQSVPRIASRHSLLKRLETINADFAQTMREERADVATSLYQETLTSQSYGGKRSPKANDKRRASTLGADGPAITLQPASPRSAAATTPDISSVGSDDESYFASADEGEHEVDEAKAQERSTYLDRRWHSMLRILYIYSLLNPSTGYVQGMNEVLFVLLYVMGTTGRLPSVEKTQEESQMQTIEGDESAEDALRHASDDAASSFHCLDTAEDSPGSHAEADAFWCFSALAADIRDLYDFDGMENAGIKELNRRQADTGSKQVTGMAHALKKFSLRLKWLDSALWSQLRIHSLDPRLPYYSSRWLACMVSTELTLPSVVRIWDAILAESGGSSSSSSDGAGVTPKIDFLIDICCALLINIRGALLSALEKRSSPDEEEAGGDDSFGRAMIVLQAYPDEDVGPIIEMACLYRQRRLAAPLTGDGPPSEDEDTSLLSVRERAAHTLRTWTNSSTPSRKPKWLAASPRTPSASAQEESLTPSRSASAALFQRYSEAIQSSDAAANWSKASTNFTAKAMATWSGTKSGRDDQQSSPLADFKTSIVNRVMSGSGSSASEGSKQVHPSLRWSVQSMPPELPIPDVNDSPTNRRDSLFSQSPLRGYTSVNRQTGQDQNGLRSPDLSSQASSTPVTSPTSTGHGRSNQQTGVRATGPKPLLLTKSARPPREASANGSLSVDEPMSRKVSSGPLATNAGPNIRRRNYDGSSSRRDSSYGGSVTSSQADRDSPSMDGIEGSSVSNKSESMQNLPSVQLGKDWLPPLPSSVAPVGLQGSGHGTGLGTVPASAFAKVRMTGNGQEERSEGAKSITRPEFGQVASSGNVPLATKTTLQRKPNRKDSEPISLASPIAEIQDRSEGFSNRDSIGSSNSSLRRYRMSSYTAPHQSTKGGEEDPEAEPKKYTLTDEPAAASIRPSLPDRKASSSSNKSVGIGRRQRAQSNGKRSRRSLVHDPNDEEKDGIDFLNRGEKGSLRAGSIDTDESANGRITSMAAPDLFPPKKVETGHGRLMPADELLRRLQLDQGFSGGESSGLEDDGHQHHSTSFGHRPSSRDTSSGGNAPGKAGQGIIRAERGQGQGHGHGHGKEQDLHDGYTTADMAAIGSALAYADGIDDEDNESGEGGRSSALF